jgi:hypothetical protein
MSQMTNLQNFIARSTFQDISEFFLHLINFKSDSNYLLKLQNYKDFNLKEVSIIFQIKIIKAY